MLSLGTGVVDAGVVDGCSVFGVVVWWWGRFFFVACFSEPDAKGHVEKAISVTHIGSKHPAMSHRGSKAFFLNLQNFLYLIICTTLWLPTFVWCGCKI